MPVHDWARVEPGIFHDFHNAWLTELRNALNGGLLPPSFYALTEQHAGRYVVDLLRLHASSVHAHASRRTLAIRHVTGHRLLALVEVVSPANKDRREHVEELANKVASALELGVHVLLADLFAPGPHDPLGIHGAVWQKLDDKPSPLPPAEPLTLVSYVGGLQPEAYLDSLAVGSALPEMALFLQPDRYVAVPLEATYEAAYRGVPAFWRAVLEGSGPLPS
jgi:hypothetical protein